MSIKTNGRKPNSNLNFVQLCSHVNFTDQAVWHIEEVLAKAAQHLALVGIQGEDCVNLEKGMKRGFCIKKRK